MNRRLYKSVFRLDGNLSRLCDLEFSSKNLNRTVLNGACHDMAKARTQKLDRKDIIGLVLFF
ncbi:hypothetical protein [Nostoc sp.]|uniref:hypothetical protein n=1 Tax=Nostoc sp. TaxID=1180 RepID=UPI002FFB46B8